MEAMGEAYVQQMTMIIKNEDQKKEITLINNKQKCGKKTIPKTVNCHKNTYANVIVYLLR